MDQLDPCSAIRIAIALVALKHKPRDRSIASYLLDLQSHFPGQDKDGRDWRTYALELEKQLAAVKAQRDADQELVSRLRTDASSDAPPPKKKSKKNPAKDPQGPEWSWDQTRADWSRILSSQYPSPPSLVAACVSLKGALASPNTDLLVHVSRIADATLRALDTIRVFLFLPPIPTPGHIQTALGASAQLKPEHIDSTRIALVSPLLMYVLRTALPVLVRTVHDSTKPKRSRLRPHAASTLASADAQVHVDRVIDPLLECILVPLLRALTPLCSARLAPLLCAPAKKDRASRFSGKLKDKDKDKDGDRERGGRSAASVDPRQTDARTDVFALIGASLEALDAFPPVVRPTDPGPSAGAGGNIASGVRHRLGLETIRELEALYAVPTARLSHRISDLPPTTQSEPPLPTPALVSAPSQSQALPEPRPPSRPESLTKRLERFAGTRADRVRALATRDAGWFLASTLNLCVAAPSHPARRPVQDDSLAESSGRVLREALLERIGKLVSSLSSSGCVAESDSPDVAPDDPPNPIVPQPKFAVDTVCQNMLLAICERALGQLAPP